MRRIKRITAVLAIVSAVILLAFCFSSCTKGSADGRIGYDASDEAGNGKSSASDGDGLIVTTTDRMMVYRVEIGLTVKDVAATEKKINEKLAEAGGYNEGLYKSDWSTRLTLRVPTEKLDEFVTALKGEGEVGEYSVTGTDITELYTTSVAKRDALLAEKARLEGMLEGSDLTVADRLTIDKRIYEIAAQIDAYSTDVASFKKQADYSTVNVYLYNEYEGEEEPSFWEQLGNVLAGSTGSVGKVFGWILMAIVALLPYLGILVVLFGLYVLIKFIVCKAKKIPFGLFVGTRANAAKRRETREKIRLEYEEKKKNREEK